MVERIRWGPALDGIFWTFRFCEFRKSSAVEVRKFFGKKRNFQTRKFFAKSLEKSLEIYVRKKVWKLFENVRKFQFFWKKYIKFDFLSQKTLFMGQKVWNKFGKVLKSLETGFSKCLEISEIVLFQTFQKLQKNDVKLKLWKSRKTRSDSKTDSKVRLKVRNAGP